MHYILKWVDIEKFQLFFYLIYSANVLSEPTLKWALAECGLAVIPMSWKEPDSFILNKQKTLRYHNGFKFSDRQVWADSVDPDQPAPRGAVWSGSTLFAIPSAPFGHITVW